MNPKDFIFYHVEKVVLGLFVLVFVVGLVIFKPWQIGVYVELGGRPSVDLAVELQKANDRARTRLDTNPHIKVEPGHEAAEVIKEMEESVARAEPFTVKVWTFEAPTAAGTVTVQRPQWEIELPPPDIVGVWSKRGALELQVRIPMQGVSVAMNKPEIPKSGSIRLERLMIYRAEEGFPQFLPAGYREIKELNEFKTNPDLLIVKPNETYAPQAVYFKDYIETGKKYRYKLILTGRFEEGGRGTPVRSVLSAPSEPAAAIADTVWRLRLVYPPGNFVPQPKVDVEVRAYVQRETRNDGAVILVSKDLVPEAAAPELAAPAGAIPEPGRTIPGSGREIPGSGRAIPEPAGMIPVVAAGDWHAEGFYTKAFNGIEVGMEIGRKAKVPFRRMRIEAGRPVPETDAMGAPLPLVAREVDCGTGDIVVDAGEFEEVRRFVIEPGSPANLIPGSRDLVVYVDSRGRLQTKPVEPPFGREPRGGRAAAPAPPPRLR